MRNERRFGGLERLLLCVPCVLPFAVAWSTEAGDLPAFKILNQSAEDWAKRLANSETEEEQRLAVYCLGEFGPVARKAVPVLAKTVRSSRYRDVKLQAIEALGLIGPDATPALRGLLAILVDPESDLGMRRKALAAVARIAPDNAEVAEAVVGATGSPVPALRAVAIDAAVTVAIFNPQAEAIPALVRAARTSASSEAATLALRCLGSEGVAPLADVVKTGDPSARIAAAVQLGRMGEKARSALKPLIKAVKRERVVQVRAHILQTVAGLAPDDPELLEVAYGMLGLPDVGQVAENVLAKAGASALPQLQKGLRMRSPQARATAARIAGGLGAAGRPLAGELAGLLADQDEAVRVAAAEALGRLGPVAASAHAQLQETARSSTGQLRRVAELAAVNVSRPKGTPPRRSTLAILPDEEVCRLLREGKTERIRVEAVEVVRERKGVGHKALMGALSDSSLKVRVTAAKALAVRGGDAKEAVPQFIAWLRVPELELQRAALTALTTLSPGSSEAAAAIVDLALSPDVPRDVETSQLLGYALRAHGVEAARLLGRGLASEDPGTAKRAAEGLAKMGKIAVAVHPELQRAALSTDDGVMKAAVDAICRLGPAAREDVPMLVRFLSYAAPSWRRAAAEALGSIELDFSKGDQHGVIDALLPVLLDPDPDLSWSGYLALYLIGKPALPKLRWLMEINEDEVPFPVLRVMAKLKADPETVLPKIAALTRPGQRSTERATAARILSLYAPEHVEPLPVLIGMLRDRDAYVVRAARVALGSYGRVAIPALRAALRGRDPAIRRQALRVLEELRDAK